MKKEKTYNEAVDGDEGFVPGEGYPSCDGEPCANVSDDSQDGTDTMADAAEGGDKAGAGSDLTAALAEWQDKFIRLQAEFDNYRKRTTREKETIYQDAKMDTIAKFLEVYDNLERAVTQAGDDDNVHKKGMEMIFHQLQGILEKLGVTVIDRAGQPFDPERHNAVMHVDDENLGENVVAQVFQKGFLLGDRVIRFAVVQVAN